MFLHWCQRLVSHPYRNTGKINYLKSLLHVV
jgi:hypothetical protein